MSAQKGYTVASLIDSLESIREPVDRIAQEAFELSKGSASGRAQSIEHLDALAGLWRELNELHVALETYLTQLRSATATSSPKKASTGQTAAQTIATLNSCPPFIASCKALVDDLQNSELQSLSPDAVLDIKSKALWFQRTLSNGSSWTNNHNGFLFYLSLLPAKPSRDYQALEVPASEIRRWRSMRREQTSSYVDANTVSYWLTLLNADFNDREPEEHHREKIFVELRNQAIPEYSKAASQWPTYAEKYWSTLRPQIFSLFNSSKSYNFVQWTLEFARSMWIFELGLGAPSPVPIMKLTDWLCRGDITPLHIACVLGLPNLCRDLISSGSDVGKCGAIGPPLLCSLMGLNALEEQTPAARFAYCNDPILYANKARAETILLLLEADPEYVHREMFREAGDCKILGLAFWASLVTQDQTILDKAITSGATYSQQTSELMQYAEVEHQCSQQKGLAATLLTCLFDKYTFYASSTAYAIEGLMQRLDLKFSFSNGSDKLAHVADGRFYDIVEEVVIDGWVFGLQRLSMDPRFDPNQLLSDRSGDTLLHSAVSADSLEIVEVLIGAGANVHLKGLDGRTPVMVIESALMIEKLVLKHGANVGDKDGWGRTIWHYAAATNDVPLLTWLCEKDPSKKKNLNTMSIQDDMTPLAEAFAYIDTLASRPASIRSGITPTAARMLLKESDKDSILSFAKPLTHLAASWGDMELIEGLEALGANFRELDGGDNSVLHYLNFSATVEVVKKLQELSSGVPIEGFSGATPAETIFTNFRPLQDNRRWMLSAHPSCRQALSPDVYALLLNNATSSHRDSGDDCLWKRFCTNVFKNPRAPLAKVPAKKLEILHTSLTMALKSIISAGALDDFEQETGKSGVLCFFKEKDDDSGIPKQRPFIDDFNPNPRTPRWNVKTFGIYIVMILENSGPKVLDSFYRSDEAYELLAESISLKESGVVKHLMKHGDLIIKNDPFRPLHLFDAVESGSWYQSLMDVALRAEDLEVLHAVLKHTTPELLNSKRISIYNLFTELLVPERDPLYGRAMRAFIRAGLEVNVPPGDGKPTLLCKAIKEGDFGQVWALLENGADPHLDSNSVDLNAIICAAEYSQHAVVMHFAEEFAKDFDWMMSYKATHGPDKNRDTNVLLQASRNVVMLEDLLEKTPLINHLNDMRLGRVPAHVAARKGQLLPLLVLSEKGADFSLQDTEGQTPLLCAVWYIRMYEKLRPRSMEATGFTVITVLCEQYPEAARQEDKQGRTPLKIARALARRGRPQLLQVLKSALGEEGLQADEEEEDCDIGDSDEDGPSTKNMIISSTGDLLSEDEVYEKEKDGDGENEEDDDDDDDEDEEDDDEEEDEDDEDDEDDDGEHEEGEEGEEDEWDDRQGGSWWE